MVPMRRNLSRTEEEKSAYMTAAKDTRGAKEQTKRRECSSTRKLKRLARTSFHVHGCSPVAKLFRAGNLVQERHHKTVSRKHQIETTITANFLHGRNNSPMTKTRAMRQKDDKAVKGENNAVNNSNQRPRKIRRKKASAVVNNAVLILPKVFPPKSIPPSQQECSTEETCCTSSKNQQKYMSEEGGRLCSRNDRQFLQAQNCSKASYRCRKSPQNASRGTQQQSSRQAFPHPPNGSLPKSHGGCHGPYPPSEEESLHEHHLAIPPIHEPACAPHERVSSNPWSLHQHHLQRPRDDCVHFPLWL
jgi:hypothetical protein